MKTLILLRHAKSSWDQPFVQDFDRPLNHRGEKDAPRMALCLKHLGIIPQHIISSPAKRAFTTASIFSHTLLGKRDPHIDDAIYEASVSDLMHVIRRVNDQYSSVLLVGHNPGLTELHNTLVPDKVDNIPTCGISVMALDISSWQQIDEQCGSLLRFEYPKKYPDE